MGEHQGQRGPLQSLLFKQEEGIHPFLRSSFTPPVSVVVPSKVPTYVFVRYFTGRFKPLLCLKLWDTRPTCPEFLSFFIRPSPLDPPIADPTADVLSVGGCSSPCPSPFSKYPYPYPPESLGSLPVSTSRLLNSDLSRLVVCHPGSLTVSVVHLSKRSDFCSRTTLLSSSTLQGPSW